MTVRDNHQQAQFDAVISSLEHGMSLTGACRAAKLGRGTLYKAMRDDESLRERVLASERAAVSVVEDALFAKASSGNLGACVFWLCNRAKDRWQDVRKLQVEAVKATGVDLSKLLQAVPPVSTSAEIIDAEVVELPGDVEGPAEPRSEPDAAEAARVPDAPADAVEVTDGAPAGKYAVGDLVTACGTETFSTTFGGGKALTVKEVHADEGAGVEYTVACGASTIRIRERGLAPVAGDEAGLPGV